jgi:hypothetical protein
MEERHYTAAARRMCYKHGGGGRRGWCAGQARNKTLVVITDGFLAVTGSVTITL